MCFCKDIGPQAKQASTEFSQALVDVRDDNDESKFCSVLFICAV